MKTQDTFLSLIEKLLAAACVLGFTVMFALGIATVVFRFIIESSLAFPEELIRYIFIWVVALGSAVAFRRNAHAAIGMVVEMLPPALKRLALLAATGASATFFGVLIYQGLLITNRVIPQISPALEVSMGWVYAAVPVGAFFLLLFAIELFIRQMRAPADVLVTTSS